MTPLEQVEAHDRIAERDLAHKEFLYCQCAWAKYLRDLALALHGPGWRMRLYAKVLETYANSPTTHDPQPQDIAKK